MICRTVLAALLFSLIATIPMGAYAAGAEISPEPEITLDYWEGTPIQQSPTIIIISPRTNETFTTDKVALKVNVGSIYWVIMGVYYEADWQTGSHRIFNVNTADVGLWNRVSITANFTEIPDGRHNVTVYANTHDGAYSLATVSFATDASPPRITVLSIENKTYFTPDMPLSFTVDEPTTWAGYSLDKQENVSIAGNITLAGLSFGSHNLVVYANDTFGNMDVSETFSFAVALPEPFPAVPVATAVVAIIVGVGLLVYSKKRKR